MRRIKTIAAIVLSLAMAFSLLGCGGLLGGKKPSPGEVAVTTPEPEPADPGTPVDPAPSDPGTSNGNNSYRSPGEGAEKLSITESGWVYYSDSYSSYVYYGLRIQNPNSDLIASSPTIKITIKAADGTVLASEEDYSPQIAPGDTVAACGQIDTKSEEPATVDFTVSVSDYSWSNYKADMIAMSSDFLVSGATLFEDRYSRSITGEVTNKSNLDCDVELVAILRDSSGKIVCGYQTYGQEVEAGGTTSFEINIYTSTLPVYETIDVYAFDSTFRY
jgi:hypothetical protein